MFGTASKSLIIVFCLATVVVSAQPPPSIEAPAYSIDNVWRYSVRGPLGSLELFNNTTASIEVDGLATATITAVEEARLTMSWNSELFIEGVLSFPLEQDSVNATLSGTITLSSEEQYETPYFLPLTVNATSEFDLSLGMSGISIEGSATSQVAANITPGPSFPQYPLQVGEHRVEALTHVDSNFTLSFPFLDIQAENESSDVIATVLRLNVTEGPEVSVPAGTFQTVQVLTEVIQGVAFGPFQLLFPGTRQVAFYSNEVGNAVLFRFFAGDTEVGNATLRSYSYSPRSDTPLWQQPALVGGLLAIPAAILVYRFWRERRKGL